MFNIPEPRGLDRDKLRLKLSAWLEHPDAPSRPVQAKIWTYGRELVLDATRWNGSRITRFVDLVGGHRAVVVETWVERTWRTPESERTEIEDRGMTLAWEFVDPGSQTLRARARITSQFRPPMHPVWRRCSSVEYCPYAPSSAPCRAGASTPSVRRRTYATDHVGDV